MLNDNTITQVVRTINVVDPIGTQYVIEECKTYRGSVSLGQTNEELARVRSFFRLQQDHSPVSRNGDDTYTAFIPTETILRPVGEE